MKRIEKSELIHCGRRISASEIDQIKDTVGLFPKLSLTELAKTIGEHLEWRTASGRIKRDACMTLLEKLESAGLLSLPAKRKIACARKVVFRIHPGDELCRGRISGRIKDLGNIEVEVVEGNQARLLFEYCMSRYHYLGVNKPFGCYMRYFFRCGKGLLGCAIFAGAAMAIGKRDKWIGWNRIERSNNLGLLINNSRYLVFPWVRVENLASHILGKLGRRVCEDWKKRWNYRPVLMETFVDPKLHDGTCYKAANWKYIGMTSGAGLVRKAKSYKTTPKKIYVKALRKDFRKCLCREELFREETS
jgi:hypothetical protein